MATYLADYGKPVINDIDARMVLSNEVLLNIFQGQIEGAGNKGVTQSFSKDTSGSQIRVIRIKPLTQEAREVGASLNGGNFPTATEQPTTQAYGLDVITVIDQPIRIAQVSRDMIPIDLLQGVTRNLGQLIDLNLNAMTVAGKFLASSGNYKEYNSASTDTKHMQKTFQGANDLLNDGDETNGITTFPLTDRLGVIRPSVRSTLLSDGVLVLGGANYAYDILAKGALSAGATQNVMENGYIGDIDGVPVHIAASAIWTLAEKYLGLPAASLTKVMGYISSGMGNLRGVATNEQIKIIDAQGGQGIELQPLYRMGFKTIYPKSNVFIYNDASAVDLIAGLVALGATDVLKIKAPASRGALSVAIAHATQVITNTLASGNTAKISKYFAVLSNGTAYPVTVEGFIEGYAATASGLKGDYTSGSAVTIAAAGTYHMWALCVDTDGKVAVAKTTATFTISG